MASIFAALPGMAGLMAYWYQFALLFEALFILTTIDTGTRVARYLLQEMGGRVYEPLRRFNWWPGMLASSALVVGAWGYLISTGSISTIWPMFGAANQLLGTLALCIGTTVLIKMRKRQFIWITAAPMVFVGAITLTGSYEMFGLFIGKARQLSDTGQAFALYLDAVLVGIVALLAAVVLADALRQWYGYLIEGRSFTSSEVIVLSGGGASPAGSRATVSDGFHLPGGGCC
jgi:carbon starvation protein